MDEFLVPGFEQFVDNGVLGGFLVYRTFFLVFLIWKLLNFSQGNLLR